MTEPRVKDWTSEIFTVSVDSGYKELIRSFFLFAALSGVVWLSLFSLYRGLPYVQNGSQAVSEEKWRIARLGPVFGPAKAFQVVAFGNSKTLAGFRPDIFDEALGPSSASYNFAIPGEERFVDLLETMLKAGTRPTHVLVQQLPDYDQQTLLDRLRADKPIVNWLFPFRSFVRDIIVFVYESRQAGGVRAKYRENAEQIAQSVLDRGYFFIKSQSHFPGDRLPDGYSLPTDKPAEAAPRRIRPEAESFGDLLRLAEQYDFQVLLVPVSYRPGEFAPPPSDNAKARASVEPFSRVRVLGPAYWTQEVSDFSDPVHLNRQGAEAYSRRLADTVSSWIRTGL